MNTALSAQPDNTLAGKHSKQSGATLLIVMLISLMLTALALGSMTKGRNLALSTERNRQRLQDLWTCETGMNRTIADFYNTGDCTDWSKIVSDKGRTVLLDVDVAEQGTANNITTYTVTASVFANPNTTPVLRRQIVQTMEVEKENPPPTELIISVGFPNASGTSHPDYDPDAVLILKNNVNIGSHDDEIDTLAVFGNILANNPNITQLIITATGSFNGNSPSIKENQSITTNTTLFDILTEKMSDFDQIITTGSSNVQPYRRNMNLIVPEGETVLLTGSSGSQDVELSNINISGTGTVIVQGDLIVKNNGNLSVASGTTILVGGDIEARNNSNFSINSTDSTLYTAGSFTAKNNANILGTLMVDDFIEAKNGTASSTFIFTTGYIEFKNNATLEGILIANQLIAKCNANIYLNLDVLPNWLAELLEQSSSGSSNGGTTGGSGKVISVSCSGWNQTL